MQAIPSPQGCPVASVPDPHLAVLDDDRFLIETIANLTGCPADEVCRRLVAEHRSLGENVRRGLAAAGLPLHAWSDGLPAFYERSDAFLYETTVWNRCGSKCQLRRWIAEFLRTELPHGGRVLCYGDGLGYDSLYLAQAGHDVTYDEVSARCRQFASAVIARDGVRVRGLASPQPLTPESFDAIVCLDVLEHVPDPPELVRRLASLLRRGGTLVVHAPFFYVSPAVGTHLRSNLRYSGDWRRLYAPQQLVPVAGAFFWNPVVLRKGVPAPRPAVPWRVRLGGWLLSIARVWAMPHILVCEHLLSRGDRRELARRAAALAALCPPGDRREPGPADGG